MRIIFLGDVMLGRLVNDLLKEVPPEYVWGDTLPLLEQADARIINLECAIADRGESWPEKTFTFRTDTKNVAVLKEAGISAVSLANNHLLDYGLESLLDCLDVLRKHRIHFAGAGSTLEDAMRLADFLVNGQHLAFISCTDNEPGWEAKTKVPGVFYVPTDVNDPRFEHLERLTRAAKRRLNALTIVSVHWGPNWGYEPLAEHIEAAHRLIDAGADVIFGHSPHIFRGIEVYRGKPILYSCGDFVDDYAVDRNERNDWSFIFQLEYSENRLEKINLTPTVIRDCQARLAEGNEKEEILDRMQSLCRVIGTSTKIVRGNLVIKPS